MDTTGFTFAETKVGVSLIPDFDPIGSLEIDFEVILQFRVGPIL